MSDVIIPGAWAKTLDFDTRFVATIPPPAIAERSKNWRRLNLSGELDVIEILSLKMVDGTHKIELQ
ncbi:MAG: hypothetical protein SAK29_16745 [Scytonema sp. PMC 1069.18]|nr:hypothetical protein [Scytonema sp. PMC 1069.18]MEC4887147.1 hypothetical protein [Scytonema sp. PMC 1070.18]